jgi:hypothetical protein
MGESSVMVVDQEPVEERLKVKELSPKGYCSGK